MKDRYEQNKTAGKGAAKVKAFVDKWKDKLSKLPDGSGGEQHCQEFWIDLIEAFGKSRDLLHFGYKTSGGVYAVVEYEPSGFDLEKNRFIAVQRDKNAPLDNPEVRRGDVFTPFEQADLYRCSTTEENAICTIIACNFEQFWFYNLMTEDGLEGIPCAKVALEEIPDNLDLFKDLFERGEVKNGFEILRPQYTEMAARKVADLYEALKKDVEKKSRFTEAKKKEFEENIPLIVMRIVFLLFADNTSDDRGKIFKNHQFSAFLEKSTDPAHFTRDLLELFKCLNIESEEERVDELIPEELMSFPYVGGGIFEETVTFPSFPSISEAALRGVEILKDDFKHWDEIDFSLFGPIMDRVFGECEDIDYTHHTDLVAIPFLFMDKLRVEFEEIKAIRGHKEREEKLKAFHDKISRLQFFDPACGSGNFLTETYMELRDLEDEVIDLENDFHNLDIEVKVSLSQFHGIEIEEYGAMVARTALQIAREQALERSYERFKDSVSAPPHFLPLKDEARGIICGNALSMDWGDLVTPSKDLFIFGGISFAGKKRAKQQKELDAVFAPAPAGELDYCAAWYYKAAKFLNGSGGKFAFMSNISMPQEVLIEKFFKPIFDLGWKISFATSFSSFFIPEEDKRFVEHSTVEIGFTQNKEDETCRLYDIIKEIYYSKWRI